MKLFLQDIKNIKWLASKIEEQKWGNTFLNLKQGFYFVFDYDLIEETSSISVARAKSLYEINDGIYRSMAAQHIGYMKEPFDTSNYLFYSLLKSSCVGNTNDEEKLKDLFITYKMKDIEQNKANLKTSVKGNQQINSNISFNTALNNIFPSNPKPVHGLCMVYDLIDNYARNVVGKSIYGELLTNIVKAVKSPNGGLIREYADSAMRYLIIGEKAASNSPEMMESLSKAKWLYRSGNDIYSVFLETGWYFNKYDFKWRKRISDDSFYFDQEKMVTSNDGGVYFLPEGYSGSKFQVNVAELIQGKTSVPKMVANGYNGKLKDYVSFQEAFDLYPELAELYSVFSCDLYKDGSSAFYFTPQEPYSLVLITNADKMVDFDRIKYIALHEMQHYIQQKEGFGNGGNENLASLIDAVGGNSVRDFYNSLSAFQKKFDEVAAFIPIASFKKLVNDLKSSQYTDYKVRYKQQFIMVSNYYKQMIQRLEYLTENQETVSQNTSDISYFILTIYSMIEGTNTVIDKFVNEYIDSAYITFFKQALEQNKKAVERDERLIKLGWSSFDLYILNFQTYEALAGEVESRFTQQTSKIPKELKDYFEFYTSETINSDRIAVYNESAYSEFGKKAEAGIETLDGKYIIHLPNSFSNSINLLHETGHIVYDFVKDDISTNPDFISNAILVDKTLEEYFCDSFVDYIHRKNIDPMLTADLSYDREIKDYKDFDEIITRVLYYESAVDENGLILRLGFVNKILELQLKEELAEENALTGELEGERKVGMDDVNGVIKDFVDKIKSNGIDVKIRKSKNGIFVYGEDKKYETFFSFEEVPSAERLEIEEKEFERLYKQPEKKLERKEFKLDDKNIESVEKDFLSYTNTSHYEGIYDKGNYEDGLHLNWGKYGYSIDESQHSIDYNMLQAACDKFNKDNKGKLYAIADYGDKFVSVYILDYDMLANRASAVESIPKEYFNILKEGREDNKNILNRLKDDEEKDAKKQAISELANKLNVTEEKAKGMADSLDYSKQYYLSKGKDFDVYFDGKLPRKIFNSFEETIAYIQTDDFALNIYNNANPRMKASVKLYGWSSFEVKYDKDSRPFKPNGETDWNNRGATLFSFPYINANIGSQKDFMEALKKGVKDFILAYEIYVIGNKKIK